MRRIFVLSAMLIFLFSLISFNRSEGAPNGEILAIVASKNFRDEEFLIPKRIFEENGFRVVVASSSKGASRGVLGATVLPDILIDKVDVDDYDAVIFIGGPGASEYWKSPVAHKIARDAAEKDKVLGAICIAPVTLANAGVLSGKKATVWPSEANAIIRKGAFYTGSSVESDGNIITANGPSAASGFAGAILKALKE